MEGGFRHCSGPPFIMRQRKPKFIPSVEFYTALNDKWRKFRKRPVIVDAFQTDQELVIETLEGNMTAKKGDWIIRGVKGEMYPCKPDIFEQTYEAI